MGLFPPTPRAETCASLPLSAVVVRTLAPLPAIAVGLAVARSHGVAWTAYLPNLVALLLGVGLILVARCARIEPLERWVPIPVALGIAATLLGDGVDSVARWIAIGPLLVNVSAALAPWLILGFGARSSVSRRLSIAATVVAQLVHVAQPDAGQASALAAGSLVLLVVRSSLSALERLGAGVAVTGAAVLAWSRPDPLAPVDHVERILFLAADRGPLGILASAAAMLPLFAALLGRGSHAREPVVIASLAYLTTSFLVTFFGHFPVPVFGAGFAATFGWYALLAVRVIGACPRSPLEPE
jgi:hypothetical protein